MTTPIELPKFNHPEVAAFYEHDLSIPKEKVEQILQLPRTTLIQDMETILLDTIERNQFFQDYPDEEQWWSFHFHALWVLVELKATESLPTVLQLLQQNDEFNWYWWVDYATEDLWEIFYHLGNGKLGELKALVLKEGHWVNRIVPLKTVEQIALHQPTRRAEVIEWYRSTLEAFLKMENGEKALDTDVTSDMVVHLIHLQADELLPEIKKLDEKRLIAYGIVGDMKSIVKDIQDYERPWERHKRRILTSIYDRYENAMKWHGYQMKYNEDYKKQNTYEPKTLPNHSPSFIPPTIETVKREGKKIGRNEPCPCGSGKKYKKCCLKK